MRDTAVGRHPAHPPSEVMLTLEEEYAQALALLDRAAIVRRMVTSVPHLTGVDMAWVGEPDGEDRIVLANSVNTMTDLVNGLVVSTGTGLGGRVLIARRPLWVSDYCADHDITHHFKGEAEKEGLKAMIAVPIVHEQRLLGVLYGANREAVDYGDRIATTLEQIANRTAAAQVVAERARHAAEVAAHEERRRLALELHDTVGAMLFTIGAGIRRLGAEFRLDETISARVAAIERQTAEAAAALRGSVRVLSAASEQVALGVALREHCRDFQERSGTAARVITLTELPTLATSRVTALADAVREALVNVEKHAGAHSVVVTAFTMRNGVAVAVSDDGVGLPESSACPDGLGLATMSDRLARIGGTFTITPNDDDGGLTVQAWVPL